MIFRQIDDIIDGRKTVTRRLFTPGETLLNSGAVVFRESPEKRPRLRVTQYKRYSVQPGRGKSCYARNGKKLYVRIVKIRGPERVQNIDESSALMEGIYSVRENGRSVYMLTDTPNKFSSARDAYQWLWTSIYDDRPGVCWEDNPFVWVIQFVPEWV